MGRSQKCEAALAVIIVVASAVFYQFISEFVSGYRFHFPGTTDQAMTPDFFPRISVSLLIFSAFCVLITVPLRKSELPIFQLKFNQIKVVLTIITSVIGYVSMILIIGFFAASIIFLFIFCYTANYKKPYIIFISGFATNLVVMALFEYGLSVQLPRGLILDSF